MSTNQHTLYRFYSDTGQLLYVGRTINPPQRFTDHSRTKPWWPHVRGITVQDYPDATTLAAAERRAITVERPLHNIQRPALTPTESAPATPTTRTLTWICETCTKPIANGTGYLHVNLTDALAADRAEAQRATDSTDSASIPNIAQFLDHDDDVRWHSHHSRCDPNPDAHDYWYDVDRLRTHADLLAHTAHLSSKRWIQVTDWYDLIARLAAVAP